MHPLLHRQLCKLKLDPHSCPSTLSSWQAFLERIEKTYIEADQGRERVERALTLSSQEMQDLYESLRQTSETRLAGEKEQTRLIVDNALDAIVSINAKGLITGWNPTAEKIFGWSNQEATGQLLANLIIPPVYREGHKKGLQRFLQTGQGNIFKKRMELPALHRAGHEFPIELYIIPLFRDGKFTFSAFLRDITERKKAEERAQQAAKDLKQKNQELAIARDEALHAAKLKSEFLATMSHEIRTPMNGILGFTGILLDSTLTAHQRESAETVRTSAHALLAILNDILDFSKIESGKMTLEPLDFDLRLCLEDVLELLGATASVKGIELVGIVAAGIPSLLHGDSGRIRQILTNLVGNAIKFTEQGEVSVKVHIQQQVEEDVWVRFDILDSGIGIPLEAQASLFLPFHQADNSTTRRFGGTGLGLAICKQLVELMEGSIGIEPTYTKGSHFWFTIKLQQAHHPVAPQSTIKTDLQGMELVCIDDHATNQQLIAHHAQEWGMPYRGFRDGLKALQTLRETQHVSSSVQVVLVDGHLPGHDGFTIARAIKSDPQLAHLHIVLMTSTGERGDASTAHNSGIAAYLTKPIRKEQLFLCLATLLGRSEDANATTTSLITSHSLKESERHKAIRILVVDDYAINQKLAIHILEQQGHRVDVAANGKEAVVAWQRVPYDLIFMDCHMPEMDGYVATQEIRQLEDSSHHTPIIAMTANAMKGDEEKCLEAGMDDYITKPIHTEHIRNLLQKWLPHASSDLTRRMIMSNEPPVSSHKNSPSIDKTAWERIQALQRPNRPDVLSEFLTIFLNDSPLQIESLRTAIQENDASTIYHAAHTLKSSSAFLGAHQLSELCKSLEVMGRTNTIEDAAATLHQLETEFSLVVNILTDHLNGKSRT